MTIEKLRLAANVFKNKSVKEKMNLLKYIHSFFTEPDDTKSMPIFVQIEPTVRCNLKCRMCKNPHIKKEKTDLGIEDFELILNKLPFLRKISFVGLGEPLLNPDIFEMIRLAKKREISIGLATNGTPLNEKTSKRLVDLGLDWINISIDGARKETFEEIRKGADFNIVTENAKRLKELTKNSGRPDVSVWFLAIQSNFRELPDMVNLCGKLGITKLNVQTAHYWGDDVWRKSVENEFFKDIAGKARPVFAEAFKKAGKEGIGLSFCNIPDKDAKRACKWPWLACYISVDGFVTPCCMNGADPDIINFGNIYKEDFSSVWNNRHYKEFRRALKSENIPSICRGCASFYKDVKIS